MCQDTDTGIGIPADKISDLFKPFSQVDGALTRRYSGTGLGLALSKRLAQALDGDIAVTSKESQGSTFTVSIDAGILTEESGDGPPTAKPPRESSPSPVESRFSGRLLLVEDCLEVQLVLTHLIRQLNVEVNVADYGEIGCQRAKTSLLEGKPYDLIRSDVGCPEGPTATPV